MRFLWLVVAPSNDSTRHLADPGLRDSFSKILQDSLPKCFPKRVRGPRCAIVGLLKPMACIGWRVGLREHDEDKPLGVLLRGSSRVAKLKLRHLSQLLKPRSS